MRYAYIGEQYHGESLRNSFGPKANYHLKGWLEAIILTEQPYLADTLIVENPDGETETLLKLCKFFSAVLRDEHPEPISPDEWSLEFEGKHHGLIGTYLNFIRRIYCASK